MSDEIAFYHNPRSRSQMVHWMHVGSEIRFAMMFGASGLKGEKVFDDYVARLSARPAARRTSVG